MVPVALSDVIAVGEVPTAAEIEILAKAGFRSLLNTQPDGEVARLIGAAEAGALADKAGMAYRHMPLPSRRPDEAALAVFVAALNEMPRPIYACCYSGSRAAAAWALAAAAQHEPTVIVEACGKAGYDIDFLRPQLTERHAAAAKPTGTPAADFIAKAASAEATAPAPAVPLLTPSVLTPRAASAGGFAVAG